MTAQDDDPDKDVPPARPLVRLEVGRRPEWVAPVVRALPRPVLHVEPDDVPRQRRRSGSRCR